LVGRGPSDFHRPPPDLYPVLGEEVREKNEGTVVSKTVHASARHAGTAPDIGRQKGRKRESLRCFLKRKGLQKARSKGKGWGKGLLGRERKLPGELWTLRIMQM